MSPNPARYEQRSGRSARCSPLCLCFSRSSSNYRAWKGQKWGSTPSRSGKQSNGTLGGDQLTCKLRQKHWKKRGESRRMQFQKKQSSCPSAQHHGTPLARHQLRVAGLSKDTGLGQVSTFLWNSPSASLAFSTSLLVSSRDESSPFHFLAFTAPSHLNRVGTPNPGVQGRCWEAETALLTSAGMQDLANWNPDKKQLSAAPWGQSLLWVLSCALRERAIAQPITQQQFPITAWAMIHQQLPFLGGIHSQFPGVCLTPFHLLQATRRAAAAAPWASSPASLTSTPSPGMPCSHPAPSKPNAATAALQVPRICIPVF